MDSNASNNIYFKPSYRTTQQGEQRGLWSAKQSLPELPQPNSSLKYSCRSVINGETEPWNSYIRSEPQEESRGSGKWRGLPKHRLQESGKFPGSPHQDAQLAASAVYRAPAPLLFSDLLQNTTKGMAKVVGTLSCEDHWNSPQVCREALRLSSSGITEMRHAKQGALTDKLLHLQTVGHTLSHYEDFIQSSTY